MGTVDPVEEWRPIPSHEAYEVSSVGRVRGARTLHEISRQVHRGHFRVSLWENGARRHARVARLVLLAFVGPCPDGMEACHHNGNGTDDRVANLRWDTRDANMADFSAHIKAGVYGATFTGRPSTLRPPTSCLESFRPMIGVLSDREVAGLAGLTERAVQSYRSRRGIVSARHRRGRARASP